MPGHHGGEGRFRWTQTRCTTGTSRQKNYDDNIFSTIDEDTTGTITLTIQRFGSADSEKPSGRCVDLGCGAGKYLPTLAANFGSVKAFDLSPKLVEVARKEAKKKNLQNVEVQVKDLAKVWYRDDALGTTEDTQELERYGFGVMTNVLISPGSECMRMAMLRNAQRSLCPGGHLLVIVPSLESALYVNMRRVETRFECDQLGKIRGSDPWPQPSQAEGAELLQGVVKRAGVRTKHFLEPEFRLLASRAGFEVDTCEQVTFTWKAELNCDHDSEVPATLHGTPLPWDWMFVLKKLAPEHLSGKHQSTAGSGSMPLLNPAVRNASSPPSSGP